MKKQALIDRGEQMIQSRMIFSWLGSIALIAGLALSCPAQVVNPNPKKNPNPNPNPNPVNPNPSPNPTPGNTNPGYTSPNPNPGKGSKFRNPSPGVAPGFINPNPVNPFAGNPFNNPGFIGGGVYNPLLTMNNMSNYFKMNNINTLLSMGASQGQFPGMGGIMNNSMMMNQMWAMDPNSAAAMMANPMMTNQMMNPMMMNPMMMNPMMMNPMMMNPMMMNANPWSSSVILG